MKDNSDISKIAIFQKKEVRKQLHNGEWWFVVNDVVAALTDSTNPAQYLKNIRKRDTELSALLDPSEGKGGVQFEPPFTCRLTLLAANKNYFLGIPRVHFVLFSQFLAKKRSHPITNYPKMLY
jgi:hypothetical protein